MDTHLRIQKTSWYVQRVYEAAMLSLEAVGSRKLLCITAASVS